MRDSIQGRPHRPTRSRLLWSTPSASDQLGSQCIRYIRLRIDGRHATIERVQSSVDNRDSIGQSHRSISRLLSRHQQFDRMELIQWPAAVDGQPIQMQNGRLSVPDRPIIPFIEGDGTGPISGGPASACSTRPSRRPTAASGRSSGKKCSPARSRSTRRQLAARRNARRVPRVSRRHQGPAHDAGRRRHSLAQRGTAADCSTCSCACGRCATSGRAHAR